MRVPRRSTIALATAGALRPTGTAYLGRNIGQGTPRAHGTPNSSTHARADGAYTRGGGVCATVATRSALRRAPDDLGDLDGDGMPAAPALEEVRALTPVTAEQTRQADPAEHQSQVGATSKVAPAGQVDAMFVVRAAGCAIRIGANDITALNGIGPLRNGWPTAYVVAHPRSGSGRHLPRLGVITAIRRCAR